MLSGILRGSGRQKVGAVVNGLANYGVGLPLQLLLMRPYGVGGLWWGLAVSATLQAAVLAVLVSRFDWRRETVRAGKLVRHLSAASLAASRSSSRRHSMVASGPGSPFEPGSPVEPYSPLEAPSPPFTPLSS